MIVSVGLAVESIVLSILNLVSLNTGGSVVLVSGALTLCAPMFKKFMRLSSIGASGTDMSLHSLLKVSEVFIVSCYLKYRLRVVLTVCG